MAVRLREYFREEAYELIAELECAAPEIEQIVITRVNERRVGFVVDHVIGGHQTVIKNLGKYYHDVEGLSGATIPGDGTVALILDIPRLVQNAEQVAVHAR